MIDDLWYKNAVIYCLDVEKYVDANGDGAGDFAGLTRRLDYLSGLGVTCIWLQPFYRSPNRDNGYDVADYYGVHPKLGSLGEFVDFMNHAEQIGLRVIVDLVVNHTSDRHHWFQSARKDPLSPYRDWYVWSKTRPPDYNKGMVFPGVQKETWTRDPAAGEYYFHRFYRFQPDLNTENPAVRTEILRIMGFWLQLGVCGFRMDAVPFLISRKGPHARPRKDYEFLHEMRDFLQWRRRDAVLLAEANVPPDESLEYFADHLHLLVAGVSDASDLRDFVSIAKQRSGFAYSRQFGRRLWQPSYYDHVLRPEESSISFVYYMFQNPVQAGLVEQWTDYPYLGSETMSLPEIKCALKDSGADSWGV